MNRGLEHWNEKEVISTLTAPGTVRTAVGRNLWSKICGKTSIKKIVRRLAFLKTELCSTGHQCNFLRTGVILVYLLVFDTILAALFGIHCNL